MSPRARNRNQGPKTEYEYRCAEYEYEHENAKPFWRMLRCRTKDGHGVQLLKHLSVDLPNELGGGFSMRDLRNMRRFYLRSRIQQPAAELRYGQVRGQVRRPASGASFSRFVEETGRWIFHV